MIRLQKVRKVLLYTLFLNIAVAAAKVTYGYSIESISMISDGFHSFSDGASNIFGLIGIWIASQPPDENHPYGHKKFENLAVIAIGVLIFGAGIEILKEAAARITAPHVIEVTAASFIIMAVTIAVNAGVMLYETKKGRELKSDFLLADAVHTRTDIFISFSVVISLIAARAGYPAVDIVASLVIVAFIAKMGFHIIKSATDVLTDAACIDPQLIMDVVNKIEGVKGCHNIRTRGNEDHVNIDLHIFVDPELSTGKAHDLAHSVEEELKITFPPVKDVVIHVEPYRNRK